MTFHKSIADLAPHYDGFIIDLWGVIHDGEQCYPNAIPCLDALHRSGKQVIFLSNAPKPVSVAQSMLDQMQIPRDYYSSIHTSGAETLSTMISLFHGKKFWFIGPPRDTILLDNLSECIRAASPEEADFALITGFHHDRF